MDTTETVYLALVIASFVVFGAALFVQSIRSGGRHRP